jgi:hypothetical protein
MRALSLEVTENTKISKIVESITGRDMNNVIIFDVVSIELYQNHIEIVTSKNKYTILFNKKGDAKELYNLFCEAFEHDYKINEWVAK